MAHLSQMLLTLTKGGIPILRAFTLLQEEAHGRPYRKLLPPIIDALQRGETLAAALRTQSKYLPDLFVEMMVAGDISGKHEAVLEEAARHYAQVLEIQRLYLRGAMYPILLLITALIIIPYVRGLLFTKHSVEWYSLLFLWGLVRQYGPMFLVIWILARLNLLRYITDPIFSRLWVVAKFWRRFALARFCRCMAIMLDAGLGLRQAIERSAAVTTHPQLKRALCKAVPMVQRGVPLDEALNATGILPEMVTNMVHMGETAGRSEEMFHKCADYLYAEAMHPVQTIGIGLEAYLILLLFCLWILSMVLGMAVRALVEMLAAFWPG
ncbi:MAG: type II secretion system F family protein [Candidatus Hydrogenedentes bacterium]|nr:type II secretion system F family protein [Candidatus Hydrogenedentota bacterium]